MKKLILSIFLVPLSLNIAMAQAPKEANPADVSSLDAIMKAVYDVISGDAGKPRDWDRFRSLFYQGARLIPTNKNADTGAIGAKTLSPDDYVARVEPFFAKEGFYESELSRQVDQYGHIAQVFSTYESKHARADAKPFARGINSFQLLFDGKRWWVLTIYWQGETPDNQIPPKYLKLGK
jgi:hypothetical protein